GREGQRLESSGQPRGLPVAVPGQSVRQVPAHRVVTGGRGRRQVVIVDRGEIVGVVVRGRGIDPRGARTAGTVGTGGDPPAVAAPAGGGVRPGGGRGHGRLRRGRGGVIIAASSGVGGGGVALTHDPPPDRRAP